MLQKYCRRLKWFIGQLLQECCMKAPGRGRRQRPYLWASCSAKYCSVKTLPLYHPRKKSTWQFKPISSVSWTDCFLSHIQQQAIQATKGQQFLMLKPQSWTEFVSSITAACSESWVPLSLAFVRFKAEARSSTLSPELTLAERHDVLEQSRQPWAQTQASTLGTCSFTEQHLLSQPRIFRSEGRMAMWHCH